MQSSCFLVKHKELYLLSEWNQSNITHGPECFRTDHLSPFQGDCHLLQSSVTQCMTPANLALQGVLVLIDKGSGERWRPCCLSGQPRCLCSRKPCVCVRYCLRSEALIDNSHMFIVELMMPGRWMVKTNGTLSTRFQWNYLSLSILFFMVCISTSRGSNLQSKHFKELQCFTVSCRGRLWVFQLISEFPLITLSQIYVNMWGLHWCHIWSREAGY